MNTISFSISAVGEPHELLVEDVEGGVCRVVVRSRRP
jgi:hypothetical protein